MGTVSFVDRSRSYCCSDNNQLYYRKDFNDKKEKVMRNGKGYKERWDKRRLES